MVRMIGAEVVTSRVDPISSLDLFGFLSDQGSTDQNRFVQDQKIGPLGSWIQVDLLNSDNIDVEIGNW